MSGVINLYQNNLVFKDLYEKKLIPTKAYYLPRIKK